MLRIALAVVLSASSLAVGTAASDNPESAQQRETVLHNRVHFEEKMLDIPDIQPLCCLINGLKPNTVDLGRRDEAVESYKEALTVDIGRDRVLTDKYGIAFSAGWAEVRLKTPFERR